MDNIYNMLRTDLREVITLKLTPLEVEENKNICSEIWGFNDKSTWQWMLDLGRKYNDEKYMAKAIAMRDSIIKRMMEY